MICVGPLPWAGQAVGPERAPLVSVLLVPVGCAFALVVLGVGAVPLPLPIAMSGGCCGLILQVEVDRLPRLRAMGPCRGHRPGHISVSTAHWMVLR